MKRKQTQFAAGDAPANRKPEVGQLFADHAVEQFAEMLMQFPDPDEVLRRAGKTRANLRALEGDDEISTALETRAAAVKATPWRLEPGEGADYDFIHGQVRPHIERILDGAWQATPYGYSVMEVTYRQDGPQIIWGTIKPKPFEWFAPRGWSSKRADAEAIDAIRAMGLPAPDCALNFYPSNSSLGTYGENVHATRPGKFFVTRRRATDDLNPYGESLLSRCYWPWFFRNNGWKFWARFLERFGAPLLVGKTSNNTKDMANALAAAVQSAVAAIGKDDEVQAISPANAGESFRLFSESVDKRIQKAILGQTLTTDIGRSGSFAAAKIHDGVRDDRRIADVKMVQTTAQAMIDTLLVLNRKPVGSVMFVMEDDVGLQTDRADRDAKLAQANIVKFTPDYLMRAYDFEQGDFEIPSESATPAPGSGAKSKAGAKASLDALQFIASRQQFTPQQQAIEDAADAAIDDLPQPIAVELIRAAIMASTDPHDLEQRLALLIGDQDPRFRELLERAQFAANVLGYIDANTETPTRTGGE